jgi:hypothetical protein
MATGAHYGHVIKHLEVSHLNALPVVTVDSSTASRFQGEVEQVFVYRNQALTLVEAAEALYSDALRVGINDPAMDAPFFVPARDLSRGRRRLDAYNHNPLAAQILHAAKQHARRIDPLGKLCGRLFYPSRFRRAFGENGTPYRSAEELFDLNPPVTKRVYAALVEDRDEYMLHAGWIVMACSGQIYGLNGAVTLLDERHEGIF